LRAASYALSRLDALFGFASVAYDHGYVRPELHDGRDIIINEGRHPVVERTLDHNFIPNNTQLIDAESLWLITGPNMGGNRHFAPSCPYEHHGTGWVIRTCKKCSTAYTGSYIYTHWRR